MRALLCWIKSLIRMAVTASMNTVAATIPGKPRWSN